MNHLKQLIESRESELDKMMPEACDCDINCTKKIAEPNDLKSFLSESIRLAYLSGLERAKELVPERSIDCAGACKEETLQNIDNEIEGYDK